jgi:hypothetical protein
MDRLTGTAEKTQPEYDEKVLAGEEWGSRHYKRSTCTSSYRRRQSSSCTAPSNTSPESSYLLPFLLEMDGTVRASYGMVLYPIGFVCLYIHEMKWK